MSAETEPGFPIAWEPGGEPISLPRGDMRIMMYLDGFTQAITLADLFLLLGRTAAARLCEPFEVTLRFESAGAGVTGCGDGVTGAGARIAGGE
jgi:hypothetical protein